MMKRFCIICLTLLTINVVTSLAYASTKEIIADGTYSMGDGETPLVAEERTMIAAKRSAVEQAGTYVESYSATKNYQLTADEVKVIASGIMEVTVLDKGRTMSGNNINFWIKIKAVVITDKIEDMVGKVKDKSVAEEYKKLQEGYEKSQQEIQVLKQQLTQAKTDNDKQKIRTDIASSENLFTGDTWIESGNNKMLERKYSEAITAFTAAINVNNNFTKAYLRRGIAYAYNGQYQESITDYNKALELKPNIVHAYFRRAQAYEQLQEKQEALNSYRQFLQMVTAEYKPAIDIAIAKNRIRIITESDKMQSEIRNSQPQDAPKAKPHARKSRNPQFAS